MGRQGDAQLSHIRGGHPGDAAGLAQILRADAGQLLAGFQRQAGEVRVFKILRDQGLFVAGHLPDHAILPGNDYSFGKHPEGDRSRGVYVMNSDDETEDEE